MQKVFEFLEQERKEWLSELNLLIEKRKIEKKSGKRYKRDERLDEMSLMQSELKKPLTGSFGRKKMSND